MSNQGIFDTTPLERVREDMEVVDERGARLGKVKRVRMGEPDAVTTAGAEGGTDRVGVAAAPISSPGGTTGLGGAMPLVGDRDEPEVPDPLRTRLRRAGFVEVDGPDLHGAARFVPGDRVAEVSGETVRLKSSDSVGAAAPGAAPPPPPPSPAPPSPATPAQAEPVLRTQLGTPRYTTREGIAALPPWAPVAGGGALVGVGAVVGSWLYRRRQQQRRPMARLRRALDSLADTLPAEDGTRAGGLGGGLLLMLLVAALLRRTRQAGPRQLPDAEAMPPMLRQFPRQRFRAGPRPPIFPVIAALAVGITLWRRRARRRPDYIGTPGIESAAGRDRTRSGEFPPDLGRP